MASHSTFASLARKLSMIGDTVEDRSTDILKGTALVVDQAVVLATPVLSGRARSAWDVAAGIEPTTVPDSDPASPASGTAEALRQGRIAIEAYKNGQDGIYISNGLPYIEALEDGSSAQAPSGMLAQGAAAGRSYIGKQKLLKGVR